MGLALFLLPIDSDRPPFSHTVLTVMERRSLFDRIIDIELKVGRDVPEGFTSFLGRQPDGEHGYGVTDTTPYGDSLKYVTVEHLMMVNGHPGVSDNRQNRAIWKYLETLGWDTKVALYWH